MENLSGPDVVRMVKIENPEMTIEEIIDASRAILLEHTVKIVKLEGHTNIFNVLRSLMDNAVDDIDAALAEFEGGSALVSSGLLEHAINYILEHRNPVSCFSWRTAVKGKTRGTGHRS
jgi:hypothetical protein